MNEYEPFEQQDFIEAEKKELLMRYIEQSSFIYATAKDEKSATMLIERLRVEFFVGYTDRKKSEQDLRMQEIMEMQNHTYRITPVGGVGLLEISRKK